MEASGGERWRVVWSGGTLTAEHQVVAECSEVVVDGLQGEHDVHTLLLLTASCDSQVETQFTTRFTAITSHLMLTPTAARALAN